MVEVVETRNIPVTKAKLESILNEMGLGRIYNDILRDMGWDKTATKPENKKKMASSGGDADQYLNQLLGK